MSIERVSWKDETCGHRDHEESIVFGITTPLLLLCLFYRWRNGGLLKRLSNLPKVAWLVRGWARIWTQAVFLASELTFLTTTLCYLLNKKRNKSDPRFLGTIQKDGMKERRKKRRKEKEEKDILELKKIFSSQKLNRQFADVTVTATVEMLCMWATNGAMENQIKETGQTIGPKYRRM